MIITYLRSSSYGTWSFCPFQFYLTYTLGLRPDDINGWTIPKPQKKADKGSITHKVLELLASKKLAMQEGQASFTNDEIRQSWNTETFSVDDAIETAWVYYTKERPTPFEWTHLDYKDVRKWAIAAMEFSGGLFNPLNRNILCPEKYFDFVIEEPWARYSYTLPDGKKLDGYLGIKGTIDLTAHVDGSPDSIELIDWKTGQRKDWATGKPKDWQSLKKDPQLRLYHYALARLYPDAKHIIITIVYTQDGGPFSMDFGPKDLTETEKMLRERFDIIRDCQRPKRIRFDRTHGWKCEKLCAFGMNEFKQTGKKVCDHIHEQLITIGIDRATSTYGKAGAFSSYGDGGGRSGEKTGR